MLAACPREAVFIVLLTPCYSHTAVIEHMGGILEQVLECGQMGKLATKDFWVGWGFRAKFQNGISQTNFKMSQALLFSKQKDDIKR